MCGRLNIHESPHVQSLMKQLGIKLVPDIPESHNVAPTEDVPVVWQDHGQPKASLMRWGLTPRFWKPGVTPPPLFNARGDSVWEKANYKSLIGHQHCLVIANGFYEWQRTDGSKQPWYFHPSKGGALAIAGIWQENATQGLECCIITTDANQGMAPIHNRMPVVLDEQEARTWLAGGARETIDALMAPCPEERLARYAVSTYVNNVRHRDANCIQPAE